MPVDLVLVRHGQSEGNLAQYFAKQGNLGAWTDEFRERHNSLLRLTDIGRRQAAVAGQWVTQNIGVLFDKYFTSEYVRAMETAASLGLPNARWATEVYLRERDRGVLANKPVPERDSEHKDEMQRKERDSFYWQPSGGESIANLCLRVDRVLENLAEGASGLRVIIVCHGGVIKAFRALIERIRSSDYSKTEKVLNCQIVWYSRRNPKTGYIGSKYGWVKSVCPWHPKYCTSPWREIKRHVYTNDELMRSVASVKQLVNISVEDLQSQDNGEQQSPVSMVSDAAWSGIHTPPMAPSIAPQMMIPNVLYPQTDVDSESSFEWPPQGPASIWLPYRPAVSIEINEKAGSSTSSRVKRPEYQETYILTPNVDLVPPFDSNDGGTPRQNSESPKLARQPPVGSPPTSGSVVPPRPTAPSRTVSQMPPATSVQPGLAPGFPHAHQPPYNLNQIQAQASVQQGALSQANIRTQPMPGSQLPQAVQQAQGPLTQSPTQPPAPPQTHTHAPQPQQVPQSQVPQSQVPQSKIHQSQGPPPQSQGPPPQPPVPSRALQRPPLRPLQPTTQSTPEIPPLQMPPIGPQLQPRPGMQSSTPRLAGYQPSVTPKGPTHGRQLSQTQSAPFPSQPLPSLSSQPQTTPRQEASWSSSLPFVYPPVPAPLETLNSKRHSTDARHSAESVDTEMAEVRLERAEMSHSDTKITDKSETRSVDPKSFLKPDHPLYQLNLPPLEVPLDSDKSPTELLMMKYALTSEAESSEDDSDWRPVLPPLRHHSKKDKARLGGLPEEEDDLKAV